MARATNTSGRLKRGYKEPVAIAVSSPPERRKVGFLLRSTFSTVGSQLQRIPNTTWQCIGMITSVPPPSHTPALPRHGLRALPAETPAQSFPPDQSETLSARSR